MLRSLLLACLLVGCVKDFREPECNLDARTMTVRVDCFGEVPFPACCIDGRVESSRPMCTEDGAPATCAMGEPVCVSASEMGDDCPR